LDEPHDSDLTTLQKPEADSAPLSADTRPGRSVLSERGRSGDETVFLPTSGETTYFDIPGYEISRVLGKGGMGIVYQSRQIALNRPVALKMVLGGDTADPRELVRFLAEAESAAAVKHPNVVQVYEYGQASGRPFLALELCPNGSLLERLKVDPPDFEASVELVRQIALGVHAAHVEGIIHRDLKPGNVLFDAEGHPKVTDFGLAKRGLGSDLTKSNAVMGTPAYMAPEQAKGDSKFVGPTADVWALGVILYECLTGVTPFRADDSWAILHNVLTLDPLPPRKRVANIPPDLEQVCLKCLRKEPHERYASAKLFAEDLINFQEGRPVTARPVGPVRRFHRWGRRNPVLAAVLGGALLLVLGLIASLAVGYREAVASADSERGRAEAESRLREKEAEAKLEAEAAKLDADRLRIAAEKAKAEADAEAARANQVSDFLTQTFRSTDPLDLFGDNLAPPSWERQRNRTAVDILHEAAARFQTLLHDQPIARAKLLASIGESYSNLGLLTNAAPLLKEALALRRAALPTDHPDIAQSEWLLGHHKLDLGDFAAARDHFRTAAAIQKRAGLPETVVNTTRTFEAWSLSMLGSPEAEPLIREIYDFRVKADGPTHRNTLNVLIGLIAHLIDNDRTPDAIAVLPRLHAAIQAQPNGQIRQVGLATIDFQAAMGFRSQANLLPLFLNQAEKSFRKSLAGGEAALPNDHLYLSLIRFELCNTLFELGKTVEADELLNRVLGDIRKTIGLAHPKSLFVIEKSAERSVETKQLPAARALFDEAEAANRERFGDSNHWLALLLARRVVFEVEHGDGALAVESAKAMLKVLNAGHATATPKAIHDLAEAGAAFRKQKAQAGRHVGVELLAATRRLSASRGGPPDRNDLRLLRDEGDLRFLVGQHAVGTKLIEDAVALDREHPKLLTVREKNWLYFYLGRSEEGRGRFVEAEAAYRIAYEVERSAPKNRPDRRDDAVSLAGSLVDLGRYAEASVLFEEVRKSWAAIPTASPFNKDSSVAHGLAVKLAEGDRRAADEFVKTRLTGNADSVILAASVAGLLAQPTAWNPVEVLDTLTAAMKPFPNYAFGQRVLHLARVRAGQPVEAALGIAGLGGPTTPYHHAVLALADLERGRTAAAKKHLAEAERMVASAESKQPDRFEYATIGWFERFQTKFLMDELRERLK